MRFGRTRRRAVERLFWSRDSRVVTRITEKLPHVPRPIPLADSGWCLIAPSNELTESLIASVAQSAGHGYADVDSSLPVAERYVVALGQAVQISGYADRIGMKETPEIAKGKVLDYFFALKANHHVEFQPIVDLKTMRADEWECLFRPHMPMLPQSISAIVDAAIVVKRPVDLDAFVVEATLARIAEVAGSGDPDPRTHYAVNLLPESLLAPQFEASKLADRVQRAGLVPSQIIIECTEQQTIADLPRLKKQVRALRRLGFGYAIDDAGAGAGATSLLIIAALEPSIVKIDREIVSHIGNKDREHYRELVEEFVRYSRHIGAKVVAEGIENRRDLITLKERDVDYGQGYLLGRSSVTPIQPKRIRTDRDEPAVTSTVRSWKGAVRASTASRP